MTKKVFLAVGHGRRPDGTLDNGASAGGANEQNQGAPIVQAAAAVLRAAGVQVWAQRAGDGNFPIYTAEANRLRVDLAVSVHHDWVGAPRGAFGHWAGGAGTTTERAAREVVSKRAADAMYRAVQAAGFPMRPSWHKKRTDLHFTTRTTVPAVLWECDRIGMVTDHTRYGRALATGILDFLGIDDGGDELTPEQAKLLERAARDAAAARALAQDAVERLAVLEDGTRTVDGHVRRLRRDARRAAGRLGMETVHPQPDDPKIES
jgi:hypothetical protein